MDNGYSARELFYPLRRVTAADLHPIRIKRKAHKLLWHILGKLIKYQLTVKLSELVSVVMVHKVLAVFFEVFNDF